MFTSFFLTAPVPTAIYTLSLHDALPISHQQLIARAHARGLKIIGATLTPFEGAAYQTAVGESKRQEFNKWIRSEEHTSELQSRGHLVCRLLLEKKKKETAHNIRPATILN